MLKKTVIVQNQTGLHARPAAAFVQTAAKFDSEIILKKDKQEVNGKSIMGILTLAVAYGQQVTICARGIDAKAAIIELEKVLIEQEKPAAIKEKK
ncbi:MAG: phosphocarrier protein HPr [Candidatus Omnitrophota bacterium]|nr:MAG: phosphocarrier protein HPr [Candidatus Omnitrophota bacterium]